MNLELIGVPYDGYGRDHNQTDAAAALRAAGLLDAVANHRVVATADIDGLPPPNPSRGAQTGLINETALAALTDILKRRVGSALDAGHVPVVYGADCSILLGIVTAMRDHAEPMGLLFVDGHEDTMPLDVSEDGEAANAEIGLLLGLTGRLLQGPLTDVVGALDPGLLAVLGPRDDAWRRRFNVGSLRDTGVWLASLAEVAADPDGWGAAAVAHLTTRAERWWLHVDLDVVDPAEFAAQGLPDVPDDPGGLTWAELTATLTAALASGGCAGLSLAIYDPDQDPAGHDARRIVRLVGDIAVSL